jgi:penicillin-binding protein 1C
MNLRRILAVAALAATSLATGALALDRIFPPDLSRYHERSSETVDANGRLLRAFTTADGKWRLKTTVDDVDPVYLALLKAYEDRRFDDHWGIDPLAAARAAGQWISRGRIISGASTISMQAARLLEPRPRGLLTKAIQSARALQLEWRYSKREVLAIYLTLAPMGGNLEGVRAASFAYFGKEPRQLSAAEAALLVAIPQSPERRRPERAGRSAQLARDRVLMRGLEHGVIDRVQFDKAASRSVPDRRLAMPMHAPHLAAWLAGQSRGAIVPTTIRFELQSALNQLVGEERGQFADRAQIALVAVDNRTGGVVAWLGGSDFFGRAGQVDLVRSHRSPGSALKPLIYAMAFDDRVLHPESIVEDVPVRYRDWLPRNFDREHVGAVTVRRALQQSLNVPAVLALEKVGPQRFISTLRNAGVAPGLPPGEAGATLGVALGSATVSPLEMAGLYVGLANGGRFAPPTVRRDRPKPEPVQLLGPTAAWYVADVLAGAPLPEGFASLPVALRDRRIAFKTGTSAGFRDAWAAGYSANWTVVVWVGHADGTPRPGQLGRLAALPIVFKAFSRLPAEDNHAPSPPADVLHVASYQELPLRMRTLGPVADAHGAPRIAYPPADARIELAAREAVRLSALGGEGRLRWLVDGRPLDGTNWVPDGPGTVRVAVVDEAGHSSAVTVRIVERR